MSPSGTWIPVATPADARVVSVRVAGSELFALAAVAGGSRVLKKQGARFTPVAEHPAELHDLCIVPSGCVFAFGPDTSACYDGRSWREHPLPCRMEHPRRIWECSTTELYALAERTLLFYDGREWREVPLPVDGANPPLWQDGDGCSSLGAWVVGTDAQGSLLAGGSRLEWPVRIPSPDPALGLVRVFGRDDAVAIGERLWQRTAAGWEPTPAPPIPGRRPLFAERFRNSLTVGRLNLEAPALELACCGASTPIAIAGAGQETTSRSVCLLPTGHVVFADAGGRVFQSRAPVLCDLD